MKDHSRRLAMLRSWNRIAIWAMVLTVPCAILVALLAKGTFLEGVLPVSAGVLGFIVFVIAYIRIRMFRCPRCNNYFTVKHAFATNSRGRACVHCGLSAYDTQHVAPSDTARVNGAPTTERET